MQLNNIFPHQLLTQIIIRFNIIQWICLFSLIQYLLSIPVDRIDNNQSTKSPNKTINVTDKTREYLKLRQKLIEDFRWRVLKQLNLTKVPIERSDKGSGAHNGCNNGLARLSYVLPKRLDDIEVNDEESSSDEDFKITQDVIRMEISDNCLINSDTYMYDQSTQPNYQQNINQSENPSQACLSIKLPNLYSIKNLLSANLIISSTSFISSDIQYIDLPPPPSSSSSSSPFSSIFSSSSSSTSSSSNITHNNDILSLTDITIPINNNISTAPYDLQINITQSLYEIIELKRKMQFQTFPSEHIYSIATEYFNILIKHTNKTLILKENVDLKNVLLELNFVERKLRPNRVKRHVQQDLCTGNNVGCCRNYIVVTLKELEFGDYVLSPYKFKLYYCHGLCNNGIFHNSNRNNAVQSKRPCCSPNSYNDMKILARFTNNQLRLSVIYDAIVGSCKCL